MRSESHIRVTGFVIYTILLCLIQYFLVSSGFRPDEHALWLYNGVASLLFGSRLLNPHFTPPADAATNGFVAAASLLAGLIVAENTAIDIFLIWVGVVFCLLVTLGAILVLLVRAPLGVESREWVQILDRFVRGLGTPNLIFSVVILICVWIFNRHNPQEFFAIIVAWAVIVVFRPVEGTLSFIEWVRSRSAKIKSDLMLGLIAAYQSPGIVLVRQAKDIFVKQGTPLFVADDHGPWMFGVALNYVGRDEGNLLRVLTATLPPSLKATANQLGVPSGSGVAVIADLSEDQCNEVPVMKQISRLCGIVDNESTLDFMQFEVIEEKGLSEGRLVEVRIGDNRHVLYQIIDGVTREEIVQQKNKYGYARAKARKIGKWDESEKKFKPTPWLPKINAAVLLKEASDHVMNADCVGHFPRTDYQASLHMSDAVTHNTAVLGILGIGKSFLAIELVERMIAEDIKVVCLDLTNQYAGRLSDFIDAAYEQDKHLELVHAGKGGIANKNKEMGGSRHAFRAKVIEQLREFMTAGNQRFIRVVNPSQYEATRQASGMFNGQADLATLTPCEITAIISDAALAVCQELGMTDKARLCLVYEEAHSLVPEWNSVAAEGDKAATAQSARAILQGRKYGLGCLLITQRTANVTKTILNQCNTIFAMRTFDDTGKEFLSNYIGSDYASVLHSLEERQAVLFGKASSCTNPILIRLNDRDSFLTSFRAAHAPRVLPPYAPAAPSSQSSGTSSPSSDSGPSIRTL